MTYCAHCGYAIKDGVAICPACGAKNMGVSAVKEEKAAIPETVAEIIEAVPETAEGEAYPIPAPEKEDKTDSTPLKTGYSDNSYPIGKYAPMSVGGYILFSVLYMIPVLGLLVSFITALASKKTAKKRFAISALILHLLVLAAVAVAVAVAYQAGGQELVETVKEYLTFLN